jgi:hypothetical protein
LINNIFIRETQIQPFLKGILYIGFEIDLIWVAGDYDIIVVFILLIVSIILFAWISFRKLDKSSKIEICFRINYCLVLLIIYL